VRYSGAGGAAGDLEDDRDSSRAAGARCLSLVTVGGNDLTVIEWHLTEL
jgi:hypothetical protein